MSRLIELVDPVAGEDGATSVSPLPSVFHLALCGVLFLGAFLLGTWGIRDSLPPYMESSHIRTNFLHFERYAERYDTVFLGSSRTQFNIQPTIFDQAMKERGATATSFNFGIAALNGYGVEFVLNQVLDRAGGNLKRVVIDLGDFRWELTEEHSHTEQVIVRHDTTTTLRYLNLIDSEEKQTKATGEARERHKRAWWDHVTSEGRGARFLAEWVLAAPPAVSPPERYNGFDSLDSRLTGKPSSKNKRSQSEHKRFLARIDSYERSVYELQESVEKFNKSRKKKSPSTAEREFVERVVKSITDAGAVPYLFIAPRLDLKGHFVVLAQDAGAAPHVLNYTDPERYPELYDADNHFDDAHLNDRGAEVFSKQIAEDIVAIESGKGAAK